MQTELLTGELPDNRSRNMKFDRQQIRNPGSKVAFWKLFVIIKINMDYVFVFHNPESKHVAQLPDAKNIIYKEKWKQHLKTTLLLLRKIWPALI